MTTKLLILICCCLWLNFASANNNNKLRYPKNLAEKHYISAVFNGMKPDGASIEQQIELLRNEQQRIQGANELELGEKSDRLQLIDEYIEMGNIQESKCDLDSVLARHHLLEWHWKNSHLTRYDESDALNNFLEMSALDQYDLCAKDKWQEEFVYALDSLGEKTLDELTQLLEQVISVKQANDATPDASVVGRRQVLLAAMRDQVPGAAILLFMSNIDSNSETNIIDPNTLRARNDLSLMEFEQAFNWSVGAMCKRVCSTLDASTLVYQCAFARPLEQLRRTIKRPFAVPSGSDSNDQLSEWIASKTICCKIAKNPQLALEAAYAELTNPSDNSIQEGSIVDYSAPIVEEEFLALVEDSFEL